MICAPGFASFCILFLVLPIQRIFLQPFILLSLSLRILLPLIRFILVSDFIQLIPDICAPFRRRADALEICRVAVLAPWMVQAPSIAELISGYLISVSGDMPGFGPPDQTSSMQTFPQCGRHFGHGFPRLFTITVDIPHSCRFSPFPCRYARFPAVLIAISAQSAMV